MANISSDLEIGIVIQGPTIYYKEVCEAFFGYNYIVWSTWLDEPIENIDYISKRGFLVCQTPMPNQKGNWNCNLQCVSSLNGIEFLKKAYPDLKIYIKIRSDLVINSLQDFLDSIKLSMKKNEIASIGYFKAYPYTITLDYFLMDFIIAGQYESIKYFFTPRDNQNIGLPFPEKWFERNYYGDKFYIKRNLQKLLKRGFFIDNTNFEISFLKNHLKSINTIKINGILVSKNSILQNLNYFIILYPNFRLKFILKKIFLK